MFGRGDALPMHGGKKNDNGVSFSVVNMKVGKNARCVLLFESAFSAF
jgi:hypothetical protein